MRSSPLEGAMAAIAPTMARASTWLGVSCMAGSSLGTAVHGPLSANDNTRVPRTQDEIAVTSSALALGEARLGKDVGASGGAAEQAVGAEDEHESEHAEDGDVLVGAAE